MDWSATWETIRAADPYAAADELGGLGIPLEDVERPGESRQSRRRLYRAGDGAWVLAAPTAPADGPRIPFSLFWAASEGAALRAARGVRGADDGARGDPPPEMLIEPGLLSRAALQEWVARHQPRYVEEGFAGFSPLTGAYVRIAHLVYHFRSIRWDPDESPYAIEFDPRPVDPLFRKLAAFHLSRGG